MHRRAQDCRVQVDVDNALAARLEAVSKRVHVAPGGRLPTIDEVAVEAFLLGLAAMEANPNPSPKHRGANDGE